MFHWIGSKRWFVIVVKVTLDAVDVISASDSVEYAVWQSCGSVKSADFRRHFHVQGYIELCEPFKLFEL